MANVTASQGTPCRLWLELEPAAGSLVPSGFSYHIEWLGPDGEQEFLLKTSDEGRQVQEGNRIHLEVDIPRDAPIGHYDPTRFEMRYSSRNHHNVREESVDEVPLPSIEVSGASHPEVPWPKVKSSG